MKTIAVQTAGETEAIDVTELVLSAAEECANLDGMLWVNTPHTTAALLLTENDEDFLVDLAEFAREWPGGHGPYRHHKNDNPNAAAHLVSALGGTQLLVPIVAGELVLGTYQRFVLLEMDGPKSRQLQLTILANASDRGSR